jgi:class 3 adenylate cyclase
VPLLDELRAQYPWSQELLSKGAPLERVWDFELSVPPERLWPILSDTSRMNRAIGLSSMDFAENSGRLEGATLNAGVLQKWTEVPWDWVEGRAMMGMRLYSEGFAHAVRALYAVEPTRTGSKLSVFFGWIPRSPAWRVFLALGANWLKRRYASVLEDVEKELASTTMPPSLVSGPVALAPDAKARLDVLTAEVARVSKTDTLAHTLARTIETGDDIDLYRLRPRVLARSLGVDERTLVVTCLHATRAGMLTLTWDLICPHCRGVRASPADLRGVPERAHCDVCDVEFGADGDNAVEVSFHVHPSIRAVPQVFFCSAEPAHKKHIVLQQHLAPHESRTVNAGLPAGRLRARVSGLNDAGTLEVAEDGDAQAAWSATRALPARCAREVSLTITNDTDQARAFVIEDARWADDALRPRDLFVMPEFKDLFSEQSLGVGVRVSVGEQTILFTDMVGSTWFYENRGDAEAFAEVRKHFAEVFAEIDAERGCVVKTVGDAVMAAFANPVDALRCARAIQRRFPVSRPDTSVRLRISVCRGPCLAVSLSSGVDFFGRTVNLAAKLQALADGHEVALPRALLEHPGVKELLAEGGSLTDEVLEHSAYPASIPAVRWGLREG